jgi:hypothetical protein
MIPNCHPLPRSVAESMIEAVTRAVCDRPKDTQAQKEARTRQLVYCTLGFEPRDGLEYMLATLSFTHFNLILDASRDVFRGQAENAKQRSRSSIVALDRALLAYVREHRAQRDRPMVELTPEDEQALAAAEAARGADQTRDAAANAAQSPPNPAAEGAGDPPREEAAAQSPPDAAAEGAGEPPREQAAAPSVPETPRARPAGRVVSPGPWDAPWAVHDTASESTGLVLLDAFRAVLDNPPPPDAGNAVWAEHMRQYEEAMIAASDDLAKLGFKVSVDPEASPDDPPMRKVRLSVAAASGD